jgi:hypothetical protein
MTGARRPKTVPREERDDVGPSGATLPMLPLEEVEAVRRVARIPEARARAARVERAVLRIDGRPTHLDRLRTCVVHGFSRDVRREDP